MINILETFYRTHDDINALYESFVAKRKLIKDTVRKNIEEFYKKENTKNSKVSCLVYMKKAFSTCNMDAGHSRLQGRSCRTYFYCQNIQEKRCSQGVSQRRKKICV